MQLETVELRVLVAELQAELRAVRGDQVSGAAAELGNRSSAGEQAPGLSKGNHSRVRSPPGGNPALNTPRSLILDKAGVEANSIQPSPNLMEFRLSIPGPPPPPKPKPPPPLRNGSGEVIFYHDSARELGEPEPTSPAREIIQRTLARKSRSPYASPSPPRY